MAYDDCVRQHRIDLEARLLGFEFSFIIVYLCYLGQCSLSTLCHSFLVWKVIER